jgi:hypothetical protein
MCNSLSIKAMKLCQRKIKTVSPVKVYKEIGRRIKSGESSYISWSDSWSTDSSAPKK